MNKDYQRFKYYKGEDSSPFDDNDARSKMWFGEKMFHELGDEFEHWTEEGRRIKAILKEKGETNRLEKAKRYDETTFGIIVFIEELFRKNAPMEGTEWILDY